MAATRKPRINRRVINSKRHTVGYIITGGEQITRDQAVRMASREELTGVRVHNGPTGKYIQSTTTRSLSSLPTTIEA